MKKLILPTLLLSVIFSGCATKQMVDERNKDQVKLKKAIVKLIKKNKKLTTQIKEQSIKMKELHQNIDSLNKKTNSMDRQIKGLKKVYKNNVKEAVKQELKPSRPLVKLWKKEPSTSFGIEVIKHKANLRIFPEPEAQIIGVASQGDQFKVIDKSTGENRWYQILYNDQPLWIYSETVRVLGN